MSFNDFIQKIKTKKEALSDINIYQVLLSIGLDNVGIYVQNGPFSSDVGIVNLHPTKGTHWFAYIK